MICTVPYCWLIYCNSSELHSVTLWQQRTTVMHSVTVPNSITNCTLLHVSEKGAILGQSQTQSSPSTSTSPWQIVPSIQTFKMLEFRKIQNGACTVPAADTVSRTHLTDRPVSADSACSAFRHPAESILCGPRGSIASGCCRHHSTWHCTCCAAACTAWACRIGAETRRSYLKRTCNL
jgi:hypothetical protein